jgi:hypothetical protein
VGIAETLCAVLSLAALLLYYQAADMDLLLLARTAVGTGSAATHWGLVVLALLLTFAAALSKEIGITVVGAMLMYDILLIPPVSQGNCMTQCSIQAGSNGSSGGSNDKKSSVSSKQKGSIVGVAGSLVRQRKLWRMGLCVVVALGYVRLRSWVAVDQLVRIYRKVCLPARGLVTSTLAAEGLWPTQGLMMQVLVIQ